MRKPHSAHHHSSTWRNLAFYTSFFFEMEDTPILRVVVSELGETPILHFITLGHGGDPYSTCRSSTCEKTPFQESLIFEVEETPILRITCVRPNPRHCAPFACSWASPRAQKANCAALYLPPCPKTISFGPLDLLSLHKHILDTRSIAIRTVQTKKPQPGKKTTNKNTDGACFPGTGV